MAEGLDTSAYPPMKPEQVAPVVAWLTHERCPVSGEILIAMAGRVARAFAGETPGIYRPEWTIEDVAALADTIRCTDTPLILPVVPSGHLDNLRYGFAMAKAGENASGAAGPTQSASSRRPLADQE
jgi:hypothetical protein